MYVSGLKAGSRIGNILRVINTKLIKSPSPGRIRDELEPAGAVAVNGKIPGTTITCVEKKSRLACAWSPQAQTHRAIFAAFCPEGHVMTPLHWTLPSCRWYGAPSEPRAS